MLLRLQEIAGKLWGDRKLFWTIYIVVAAALTAATINGRFDRNLPPRLPLPYGATGKFAPPFTHVSKEKFLEALNERPNELTEVQIFGALPTLVVRWDDHMREVLVDYGPGAVAELPEQLRAKNIKYKIGDAQVASWEEDIHPAFWWFALPLAIIGLLYFVTTMTKQPGSESGGPDADPTFLGRHNVVDGRGLATGPGTAPPAEKDETTALEKKTFADVAGCDEAIEKLIRVRKWLRKSFWFNLFGARIPKGILLLGPPGTGKTLLARALAGETDANFFSISASEFVEMYVGVGAKRVREIFEKAKAARKKNGKPSIIFIDELDAVGKKRTKSGGGGDSERDQTLNQILTCMQGFKPSSGILVVAATNLAETLDPALLRPGRFDYHVSVDYPDIEGREKIFKIHSRGMQLAPDISTRMLAIRTTNMTGAHIELVCSEAGVLAAERLEHLTVGLDEEAMKALPRQVTVSDFDRAIDFVQFGDELLSRMRNQPEDDAYNTSIHEAGHAVMATATGGDRVTKITRTIRSKSLGMMQAHSESNRYGMKEEWMRSRIITAMGGQAAQVVILGFKDTGASNDFEQANRLARAMVGAYGMSALGPIQLRLDDQGFPTVPLSPHLASKFDEAWMGIISESWDKTLELTKTHQARIERIGKALMAEETILGDRYAELYEGASKDDDLKSVKPESPITIPDDTSSSS